MKKLLLPSIFALLLIPLVQASNLYIENFANSTTTYNLQEKDAVRINIENKTVEVMLRQAIPEQSTAKLTIFIEGAETPQYVSVKTSNRLYLDVNRDQTKDIMLQTFYVSKNNTVLSLTKLEKNSGPASNNSFIIPDETTTIPQENLQKNRSFLIGIYITSGIIILGLITYFLLKKKK